MKKAKSSIQKKQNSNARFDAPGKGGGNAFPAVPVFQRRKRSRSGVFQLEEAQEGTKKDKQELLPLDGMKGGLSEITTEIGKITGENDKTVAIKTSAPVQRVINYRQAQDLLRRLSRCARQWKQIYDSVERILNGIGRVSSTNLTAIINALKQQHQGDEEMITHLNQLQGIVDELERLANEIDHLGGDILRAVSGASGDQMETLDEMFENIKDMISQE